MRIGYDAKRAFFNNRGLGNYSRGMIRIVSENNPNEQIHLFTPKSKHPISFEKGNNCIEHNPQGFWWSHLQSFWRSYGCINDIKAAQLDIFHGLSHELPVGIEKTGIKTVVTMHDVIFLKHPEWFPLFDRYLFKKKYVDSCKRADKVVAISEMTKQDVMEYIGIDESRIEVVYQGCDPIFTKEATEAQKRQIKDKYNLPSDFIVTVCAIEERKNHKCVINALAKMKDPLPYLIIGRESKYKQELEEQIKSLHLEKTVRFLHNVPTEDMPALLQQATLLAYPSYYEGFGIPIIEAQSSHIPVLTSTGSCFKEVGKEGALYLNPDDSDEWAHQLENVTSDSALRQSLISQGGVNAGRFSDQCVSNGLMNVYRSLL